MILVVVADRSAAQIFSSPAFGAPLEAVAHLYNRSARVTESSLHSDAPGRVLNRASGAHQSYDPGPSAHEHAVERFVDDIASTIARHAGDRGVVLIAEPRLLAQIRRACGTHAQVKIVAGLPKNLAHESRTELATRLLALKGSPVTDAKWGSSQARR